MRATLPTTSLPAVLQTFLRAKGYKKKDASVWSVREPVVELDPARYYDSRADDFDPGDRVWALSLKHGGSMVQPTAGSMPTALPASEGPWARVTIYGRGGGASITVDFEGAKLFASAESLTLPPEAAQLLFCLTKRSAGEYRARCARAVPGGRDGPFADWLQENGLVKRNAGGSYVATALGKQVAAKLPDTYDPEYQSWGWKPGEVMPQHQPYVDERGQLKPYTSGGSLLGLGFGSSWMRTPGGR